MSAGDPDVEEAVERAERLLEARDRYRRLKPEERTALALFGLGYSYKEIADMRGWSYTKVSRCIREGRAKLRAPRRS
jgi:DNA-directed RNA polymerase specialized sigma24 family protein